MECGRVGVSKNLHQHELRGIVVVLQDIEPDISRLPAGILMVVNRDLLKFLDKFRLYIDKNKGCNHGRYLRRVYSTTSHTIMQTMLE